MFVKPVKSLWWKLQWELKVLSILLIKPSKCRPCFLLVGERASIVTIHRVQPPVFLLVASGATPYDKRPASLLCPFFSVHLFTRLFFYKPVPRCRRWPLSCPQHTRRIAATKTRTNQIIPVTWFEVISALSPSSYDTGKNPNNPLQWHQTLLF